MTYDLIFRLVNLAVLPAWAMLIFLPRWSGTRAVVHSMLYPLGLGAVYVGGLLMILFAGHGSDGGGFSSLEGVRMLFSADAGLMIGWTHYLVFDLFVGAWIARDGQRRGVAHLFLIPCLFFTLMAGPLGLLLYVIVRKATGKGGWSLFET